MGTNYKRTPARPGSKDKVSELAKRLRACEKQGKPLFHPGDAPATDAARQLTYLLVVRLTATTRPAAVNEAISVLRGALGHLTHFNGRHEQQRLPCGRCSVEEE